MRLDTLTPTRLASAAVIACAAALIPAASLAATAAPGTAAVVAATAQLDIGDAGAYCQPVTAAGLRVYPPDQRVAKVVPIPFGACPHAGPVWMHLEPVQGQGGSASRTAQR
jgi:hypothetical protein